MKGQHILVAGLIAVVFLMTGVGGLLLLLGGSEDPLLTPVSAKPLVAVNPPAPAPSTPSPDATARKTEPRPEPVPVPEPETEPETDASEPEEDKLAETPSLEELREQFEALRLKLRAELWRHSPYATGLEAFFQSLPGEGEALAALKLAGQRISAELDASESPIAVVNRAFDLASDRGVAHLAISAELEAALPVLALALKPVLEAELPEAAYMIPTRQQRESGDIHSGVIESIKAMKAMRMHALALLRTGEGEAGGLALEQLVRFGLYLRGTSLLDMMVLQIVRHRNLDFLTSCFESRLVDADLVQRLVALHESLPHDWELVLVGEAVQMLSQLDTIADSEEWKNTSSPEDLLWLTQMDSSTGPVLAGLDPETLPGRIFRGGAGIRLAELDSLGGNDLMNKVLGSIFVEQSRWDLLAYAVGHGSGEPLDHGPDLVSTDMRHLMRVLRGGASPLTGVGGGGLHYHPRSRGSDQSDKVVWISTSSKTVCLRIESESPAWKQFPDIRNWGYMSILPMREISDPPGDAEDSREKPPEAWMVNNFAGSTDPVRLAVRYYQPDLHDNKKPLELGKIYTDYQTTTRVTGSDD